MNRWVTGLVWLALLILALAGWVGWGHLVLTATPDEMGSRFAFLVLLFVAVSSTLSFPAYLATRWVRRRWPAVRGGIGVAIRQGVLGALFVVACAVLQMSRALTGGHVVLILSILAIVEVFLQVRRENPAR